MALLNDSLIVEYSKEKDMISPFSEKQVSLQDNVKVISYGTSSYGYDVRLLDEFFIFCNSSKHEKVLDPKNFSRELFYKVQGDGFCILPPNSFLLGKTLEYFKIPRNVLVLCVTKSTYARCGINVTTTSIEPEFEGNVVLEISNFTPFPVKIYANEGISQFLFLSSKEQCEVSYKDREGKYMKQKENFPKV